jgi:hypothetical protein
VSAPFHRTPLGLSNQATFAKVDAIIFAEGGSKQLRMADVELGAGDSSTLDSAFWSSIFRAITLSRSVEVRSVGNKLTVEAIAGLVAAGAVTRVIVAMDRDFDDRRNRKIGHTNILYTYGYSWENDVFNEEVAMSVVRDLAPSQAALTAAHAQMRAASQQLQKCFSKLVRLDHILAVNGEEVTARHELQESIRLHEVNAPVVDRSSLAAEIGRCRAARTNTRLGPANCASVEADLHGHTVAKWWLAQIHHFLRTYTTLKMSREIIARFSIAAYVRRNDLVSLGYYRDVLNVIAW